MKKYAIAFVVCCWAAWVCGGVALSQTEPRPLMWDTDGQVHALAKLDNKLFVGGRFTYFGPRTGAFSRVDLDTGRYKGAFPYIDGTVYAIAPDGDGGWFVGGDFKSIDQHKVNHLAHIKKDMTVDAEWKPNANGKVLALQLVNGKLFAGGEFTLMGGLNRKSVACLDLTTGTPTAWSAGEVNAPVYALASRRDMLYIGGAFTTIAGKKKKHLAAMDARTAELVDWRTEPNADVFALVINDYLLYVGGAFSKINNEERNCIASVDVVSGAVSTWNPKLRGEVYDIEWRVEDYIAVNAIAVSGLTVFVGGEFSFIDAERRNHIAAIDATTGAVTRWQPKISGQVRAMAVSKNKVYLGGKFDQIDGLNRKNLCAIDMSTGRVSDWRAEAGGEVLSLYTDANGLMVGGNFTSCGGKARNCLAAIDLSTYHTLDWNPNEHTDTNACRAVYALSAFDKALYVGGDFDKLAGQTRRNAASISPLTGGAFYWNPNIDGVVYTIAPQKKTIYVGGKFRAAGDEFRQNIAAFDDEYGRPLNWIVEADDAVKALLLNKGQLYAAGAFRQIGGKSSPLLALLNAKKGNVVAALETVAAPQPNACINALHLKGSMLFVGGRFQKMGDDVCQNIAALEYRTLKPLEWRLPVKNEIFAMAAGEEQLYIAGELEEIGNYNRLALGSVDLLTARIGAWQPNWNQLGLSPNVFRALIWEKETLYAAGYCHPAAPKSATVGVIIFPAGATR